MAGKSAFREDLARHQGSVRWLDRGLWIIASYRLGRRILAIRSNPVRRALLFLFFPTVRVVETLAKMSLPAFAEIGGGLRISSAGLIFVHSDCVIGRNCTLGRGVTIGNAREGGPTPIVGDNVEIGPYAQVLGDIHVGDGAKIAPMTVVLNDVPAGSVARGIPAKISARGQPSARTQIL